MVFTSTLSSAHNEPPAEFKDSVSLYLWRRLDTFAQNTLFVDFDSGREWSGARIKRVAARAALYLTRNNLIEAKAGANSVCLSLYPNCDHVYLVTLAALFAGCATCAADGGDPRDELEHLVRIVRPRLVCAGKSLVATLVWLMQHTGHKFNVCIMDDDDDDDGDKRNDAVDECARAVAEHNLEVKVIGLNAHLLHAANDNQEPELDGGLPMLSQSGGDEPAFLLLTSGSTGRPKPVIRSQRNALYDCHLFRGEAGARLWQLNSSSVMAAHLPLDHGTGTFNFLISIGEGVKVILMKWYDFEQMCSAIKRYKISDCMLGSALLHNFIESPKWLNKSRDALADSLGSLRNFIAIGSPIVSHSSAAKFMRLLGGQVSIRQAFGMTECGFVSCVERERSLDCCLDCNGDQPAAAAAAAAAAGNRCNGGAHDKSPVASVGKLLPGVRVRLRSLENADAVADADHDHEHRRRRRRDEVDAFDTVGELYLSAPTVAPGYWGAEFADQSRNTFLSDPLIDDGRLYYRSRDLAKLLGDSRELVILGRSTDVLSLYDGWKVLPHEIELVLLLHPKVLEAAVVGVPHPSLPGQHAPRAYVVVRAEWRRSAGGGKSGGGGDDDQEALIDELKGFVATRVSPPKRLDGGLKLLDELPRVAIGKVDKRALLAADGY